MFKNLLVKAAFFFLVFFTIAPLQAQESASTLSLDIEGDVLNWYDQQVGQENTVLQIGSLNNPERKASGSHQYLESASWTSGNLVYRGQYFENVQLLYDIYEEAIITRNISNIQYSIQPIELIKEQVSSFTLHGANFEWIDKKIDSFENGFFEIIYRGDQMEVLAKRIKSIQIGSSGVNEYKQQDKYYLIIEDIPYRIYRKRSIIARFPEHKKQIKSFIKKNQIDILEPGTDYQLKSLIQFCDNLDL